MRIGLGHGLTVLCALAAAPAVALDFELGESATLKMVNKFTIGAGILNVPDQFDLCQDDDCV
jgi:hypothetical protein